MQKDTKIQKSKYHPIRRHVRKHKKKYLRFISFLIFLVAFGIVEDLTALYLHGIEFKLMTLVIITVIAFIFTVISELTEFVVVKEEPKIREVIKKEEKIIKKDEEIIKKKLKKI